VAGTDGYAVAAGGTESNNKGAIVGKDSFLKLLVAQIKNQNPLSPADGVEFVTQLAQFSELEQLINIRTELESLSEGLQQQKEQAETAGGAPPAA